MESSSPQPDAPGIGRVPGRHHPLPHRPSGPTSDEDRWACRVVGPAAEDRSGVVEGSVLHGVRSLDGDAGSERAPAAVSDAAPFPTHSARARGQRNAHRGKEQGPRPGWEPGREPARRPKKRGRQRPLVPPTILLATPHPLTHGHRRTSLSVVLAEGGSALPRLTPSRRKKRARETEG
ncbi:hypothetical protein OPV22_032959 [Ensete ventricosum]|uniref:Uncharacterized protein n=1 Tax=Ensete ventricosum TaxID=4639 RepID=A0AAV8PT25_ENSVE|nr:hypothetical protein OPV22_032959 [Ensete ventricosum]